jgi:intraflagellar transport protein 122
VVREWPNPNIPNQFFRMMDDEVPLMVGDCGHFFEQDEYEMVRRLGEGTA